MATYPVKYINNAMRGAPQVSGTPGTLLAALRACLITGFGLVAASSVTVAGGIATATLPSGQSFDPYCVVLVEGATPDELNGEQRVLTASSTSITWATTAADGAATGTITIKVAPVGQWEELFAGTVANKAVFRSTDVTGSRFCWWVDDTGTTAARVRGFESMTDVNTGTGPFPADAQISGGGYQLKSPVANTVAARYDLVGDSRFVLYAGGSTIGAATPLRGFGDLLALRPAGDAFAVAVSCSSSSSISSSSSFMSGTFDRQESGADAVYCARTITGLGGAQQAGVRVYVGSAASPSGADPTLGAFPSAVDGELKYSGCCVHAGNDATPRADVPGVLRVPQSGMASLIAPRDVIAGAGARAGRRLLALGTTNGNHGNATVTGIVLVDITGPWR